MGIGIISPVQINTERLCLRSYIEGDEDLLFTQYYSSVEASKYLQRKPHVDINQTRKLLERMAHDNWIINAREFIWIISCNATKKALGVVVFFNKQDYGEIHFGIGYEFQRNGFMKETLEALILFLKSNNEFRQLETFCAKENIASQNLLLKMGFSKVCAKNNFSKFPLLGEDERECINYSLQL